MPRRWAWGLVTLAGGCEGPDPSPELPAIVWRGTYLDYAPQEHVGSLCAGTLPYMDRYVELVAARMGVTFDAPVLYVQGSPQDESFCDDGAVGCTTLDGRVYSHLAPHEHELVHGVRSFEGFSHPFFEEGAAEAFGDDALLPGRGLPEGDLFEGIQVADPDGGYWYPRMGHFAAYLQDRHGDEVTAEILRQTDWTSTAREAIVALERATGMSFGELRDDYESEQVCDQARYRYPVFPCDAPEAFRVWCNGGEAVRIEEQLGCMDAASVGPRQGEVWKYVAFEVPVDGEYTFARAAETVGEGSTIEIKECSNRCDSIQFALPITGTYADPDFDAGPPVFLRMGRYSLRFTQPVDAPLTAVSVWMNGADCR
jgi:hypothetical protein